MEKIKVELIYPLEFDEENRILELTEIELMAMVMSNKVGSKGKYFKVVDKIFEDIKDECVAMTIKLEYE